MKRKRRSRPHISSLFNSIRFHHSQNPFDMSKLKNVKWKYLDSGDPSSARPDTSSNRCEASAPPGFSAPKTSEYEYFRKFKKNAGHLQTYPPNNNDNQFGEELRNPGGETLEMVKHSRTNDIYPFLVEQVTPINFNLFSSTTGPLQNSNTHPRMEQEQKGIFAMKREKLQRMVASIFPEVNELTSDGCIITKMLLSRLLPDCNEDLFCGDIKMREAVDKSRFQSSAFPNTDIHKEKLCRSCNKTFVESECGHFLDNESSMHFSKKFNQSTVPKWDIVVPDPPTRHARKPHIEYQIREGICDLDSGQTTSLETESYSSFDFEVEKFGSFSGSHVGDIDEYWNPHGPDFGKETCPLLLRWVSSSRKVEQGRCHLDSGITANLQMEKYSAFDFPIEKFGSSPVSHFAGTDELWNLCGPPFGKEPRPVLLGWDSCSRKDEQGRCHLDSGRTANLQMERCSSFDFPIEKLGSFPVSHFAGTNEHWNLCGPHFGEEPRPLLSGWDSCSRKDEQGRCHLDSGKTANLQMEMCSSFDFPIETLGSFPVSHFAGTDEHWNFCGPHFGEESRPLLFGRDSCSRKDEQGRCHLDPGRTAYLQMERCSAFDFPIEKLGSSPARHFPGTGKHQIPCGPHFGEELRPLLLGWDSNSMNNEQDLSVALYYPEQRSYATTSASQVQSGKERLGRTFGDTWLDSSIFLFNHEFERHNIEY